MRRDAQTLAGGIYRPRNPRASPLYQCIRRHADELETAGLITRPVEAQVLERFLACGDLHKGFARIYCDQCGHDYLLAYSCKTRYFCPSCHQKRMLAYGEWLEDKLLSPVPHRQYVFTLPKLQQRTPTTTKDTHRLSEQTLQISAWLIVWSVSSAMICTKRCGCPWVLLKKVWMSLGFLGFCS